MSFSSLSNDIKKHIGSYLNFCEWESYTLTSKKSYNDVSEWPENKIDFIFRILETEKAEDESFFEDSNLSLHRQICIIFEAIFNNQPVATAS